jgi:hypothetical protein
MKKYLLGLLLVLSSFFGFSQSRIGFSEREIRNEFSAETFKVNFTDKGIKYIYFTSDYMTAMYFLNSENICTHCIAIPNNVGTLNALVQRYNKEFVIINDVSWKYYTGSNIIYITLNEINNVPTFIYTTNLQ